MRTRTTPISLLIGMAAFAGLAQTAQQGDPKKNPGGYEEFHSPMVLETVFPMWIKGKRDAWVTSAESQRLRTFRCDRISILSLSTNAREASSGQTEKERDLLRTHGTLTPAELLGAPGLSGAST